MATCEVCGNDYDMAFEVRAQGAVHVFDSFECAIHAMAPVCEHCGCKIVGHGVQADDLRCPRGLSAEVGESVRCTFTVGGQPVDAVATISAVDGETVTYDVHTEARPVAKAVLERSVAEKLGQAGVPAGTASCAGDLPAHPGATVGCTLSGPEGESSWTVRTTSVDGGKIDYSIEQAGPS